MSHIKENIQNMEELEFAIFCIENLAMKLGVNAECVYNALSKSGILNEYIVPSFDVLHTQGKEYILDDILELMKEKETEI